MNLTTFEEVAETLKNAASISKHLEEHLKPENYEKNKDNPSFMLCLISHGVAASNEYLKVQEFYDTYVPNKITKDLEKLVNEKTQAKAEETVMPDVQTTQDGQGESLGLAGQEAI
jgi:hypothetical protein